jgi:hypothetical protein
MVVEKEIKAVESGYNVNTFDTEILEALLSRAFASFVRSVAADPDIRRGLQGLPVAQIPSFPVPSSSPAASATAETQYLWILGSWVTRQAQGKEELMRFDFKQEGSRTKWQVVRRGWMAGVLTDQEGSGWVSWENESALQLNGKYDSSHPVNIVGQSVQYSFAREGGKLRGFEILTDGTRVPLELERVR